MSRITEVASGKLVKRISSGVSMLMLVTGLIVAGSTAVAHAAAAAPAISPGQKGYVTLETGSGAYGFVACRVGTHYPPSYTPDTDIAFIINQCGGRVWLHQDSNGGGLAMCIGPGSEKYSYPNYLWVQFPGPGNLQITSNGNPC